VKNSSLINQRPVNLILWFTAGACFLFALIFIPSATDAAQIATQRVTADPFPPGNVLASTGFDYPVGGVLNHEGFEMNNCFGCTVPELGLIGHTGEDFYNAHWNDPVYSVSEGVVLYSAMGPGGWGNVVIIQHKVQGASIYTQYAHLTTSYVSRGQAVGRRQIIGAVGDTGTIEPHLHFEIKDQPSIGHGYTDYGFVGATTIVAWGMYYLSPSWYINNHRHLESPYGSLDAVHRTLSGFRANGWALDPDTAESIGVHLYLDGRPLSFLNANEIRPDVGVAFPGNGSQHGYTVDFTTAPGNHTLCVYGINVGPGHNNLIACRAFTYSDSPMGSLDRVVQVAPGLSKFSGWAIDPNSVDATSVHFYADGTYIGEAVADVFRGDIGSAYPFYGPVHGYSADLPLGPGAHTVCAYGINSGAGANSLLGCRVVNVPINPFGSLDAISYGPSPGTLRIRGWAIDPDTTSSINIHGYVNGQFGVSTLADVARGDIGAVYPGLGSAHGFDTTVRVQAAHNQVCVYGINAGPGSNALLSCKAIDVLVNPMGVIDNMDRAMGNVIGIHGWALDPDTSNSIIYHVYSDGVFKGQFTASSSRPDIAARYPAYGAAHGIETEAPGIDIGPGAHNVCVYGINADAGVNSLLGCRTI